MSIIAYRDPLDSTANWAFETDGVNLYFGVNGARYSIVQTEQLTQLNELLTLLTLELVEQGWPVKSPRLLELLNNLSNTQR